MGQCYSVYLDINIKNEDGLLKILREKFKSDCEKGIGFAKEQYKILPDDSINGIISLYLASHQGKIDIEDKGKKRSYSNDFDASYGWWGVMYDLFESMIPYLYSKDSEMDIFPDNGENILRIRKGKIYQIDKNYDED